MDKKDEVQVAYEHLLNELGAISCNLTNGDYCKHCWKFSFCSQVPFSKNIFHPCKGFIKVQKSIQDLSKGVDVEAKEIIKDFLDYIDRLEKENRKLKEEKQ